MSKPGKTFKDLKDAKDWAKAKHEAKDPARAGKGGHTNLLREALEELEETDGLSADER